VALAPVDSRFLKTKETVFNGFFGRSTKLFTSRKPLNGSRSWVSRDITGLKATV